MRPSTSILYRGPIDLEDVIGWAWKTGVDTLKGDMLLATDHQGVIRIKPKTWLTLTEEGLIKQIPWDSIT